MWQYCQHSGPVVKVLSSSDHGFLRYHLYYTCIKKIYIYIYKERDTHFLELGSIPALADQLSGAGRQKTQSYATFLNQFLVCFAFCTICPPNKHFISTVGFILRWPCAPDGTFKSKNCCWFVHIQPFIQRWSQLNTHRMCIMFVKVSHQVSSVSIYTHCTKIIRTISTVDIQVCLECRHLVCVCSMQALGNKNCSGKEASLTV